MKHLSHFSHILAAILLPFFPVGACSGFDFAVAGSTADAVADAPDTRGTSSTTDAARVAVPRASAAETLHAPDSGHESGDTGDAAETPRAGDGAAVGDSRAESDGRAEAAGAQ